MMLIKVAAYAGAKTGETLGVQRGIKTGARAGARAGAEAGSEAGARAGAEAAANAARKTATELLRRALALANGTHEHVVNIYGKNSVVQKSIAAGLTSGYTAPSSAGGSIVNNSAISVFANNTSFTGNGASPMTAGSLPSTEGKGKSMQLVATNLNKTQTSSLSSLIQNETSLGIKTVNTIGYPANSLTSPGTLIIGGITNTAYAKPTLSIAGYYVDILSKYASHSIRAANGSNPSVLARYFVDPQGMANKCKSMTHFFIII